MYSFDEYLFNDKSRILWNKFGRKKQGLKTTYMYLSVLSKDKRDSHYGKWFRTSSREVSYRSGLDIKRVKEYINSLRYIGLVDRRIKRKKVKEGDLENYKTESYYRVRPLNVENFNEAMDKFDYIDIAKYVKQTDKKERIKS